MKAVEYLSTIEPITVALFTALGDAERKREEKHRYLEPKSRYLERLNYAHSRAEAHQALLLIDGASAAAAGAVLQIARLCISIRDWPEDQRPHKGRKIGSQALASVIWYSRNQAVHFEEGDPKSKKTRHCLDLLHKECGLEIGNLDATPRRSLARQVINLLGWHSYELFAKDMVTLLAEP